MQFANHSKFFTPTILTQLGYDPVAAQVHSIPIFSEYRVQKMGRRVC